MSNARIFGDPEFGFRGEKREPGDTAAIRLRNLDRESTVKLIGLLYFLGALLTVLNTVLVLNSDKLFGDMVKAVNPQVLTREFMRTFAVVIAGVSVCFMVVFGFLLRRFSNFMRWTIVIFSILALLGGLVNIVGPLASGKIDAYGVFGLIGLVPSAMFTWFLASSKNATIFREDYRTVIAQTPQIQPHLGSRDYLFLGVYIVVFLAGLVFTGMKLAGGA